MAGSPSQPIQSNPGSQQPTTATFKMSMLAMATPSPHPTFSREYPWDGTRCSDYSLRPRMDSDRVALPSIRQAFPELQLRLQPRDVVTNSSSSTNNPLTPSALGTATSPEYVHSPNENKRRRLSHEEEQDFQRPRQVPRLHHSPEGLPARQLSPSIPSRSSLSESWTGSTRSSPFQHRISLPVPLSVEAKERPTETRSSLPTLPPPHHAPGRESVSIHRAPASVEAPSSSRPNATLPAASVAAEPAPTTYQGASYGYPYHHPTRYQSLSTGAVHHFDRTPFTNSVYGGPYQDFVRFGDVGAMGVGSEDKRRKRRGNLPRETTDKLRAWFVAHLSHPYPTEDEKQELMRQTGLQMNQISNWFINARRRQLPTMISNAQAESDAMAAARNPNAKVLATTERGDFVHVKRETAGPLSDGEGMNYDEDLETFKQRRIVDLNRGSV